MTADAAGVLAELDAAGATVAVAESLTGGLLAAALVAVPGASRCFRGSVTAYATDLKASVLGVDAGLLAARGAVDAEVAGQMAEGVRRLMGADYGVATTGVAGPDPQDGQLARKHDLVTDFGKIADPIADKAIMGTALVALSALGDLAWWVTIVILVREIGITLMRFWVIRHGVIPASRGGKLKTLTQGIAVGMYVLVLTGPLATARAWLMALAVILTVVTGLDYVKQAVVVRREGLARAANAAADAEAAAAGDRRR